MAPLLLLLLRCAPPAAKDKKESDGRPRAARLLQQRECAFRGAPSLRGNHDAARDDDGSFIHLLGVKVVVVAVMMRWARCDFTSLHLYQSIRRPATT